jgi:hypothetical protein
MEANNTCYPANISIYICDAVLILWRLNIVVDVILQTKIYMWNIYMQLFFIIIIYFVLCKIKKDKPECWDKTLNYEYIYPKKICPNSICL